MYVWPPEFNTLILKGTWSIFQLFFFLLSLPSSLITNFQPLKYFKTIPSSSLNCRFKH